MMMKNYHEVFVPLPDVYELSGPEVFNELKAKEEGKENVVVIPFEFIRQLGRISEDNPYGGANDVLQNISVQSSAKKDDSMDVRHILDGMDVSIVHEHVNEINLEERIKDQLHNDSPTFITNDLVKKIELSGKGLRVESPEFLKKKGRDIVNEGIIMGTPELHAKLYENHGVLTLEDATTILDRQLHMNQFIRFVGNTNPEYARVTGHVLSANGKIIDAEDMSVTLLNREGRRSEYSKKLRIGSDTIDTLLGITPTDMEQYLALQYGLLNPDVKYFFLCGSQGSGKTLLSYVSAVEQILLYEESIRRKRGYPSGKHGKYKQIVLFKPNDIIGKRDIGYLPGNIYQKIKPHLESYIDAHRESNLSGFDFENMLRHPRYKGDFGSTRQKDIKINKVAGLNPNCEAIEFIHSGFIRGRSFRDTLILVDEAQNYTPYEMKTITERAGMGCKIVVMGDPDQVDNPICSRDVNGVTHAIDHYLDKPYSALVTLSRNYRSEMSNDARNWNAYSK